MLANEQVIDGHCERCGTEVESKSLTQWFFKITDYADQLLDEMDTLESWPDRVLTMQRNWIGRSERARDVPVQGTARLPVFTTRTRHAVRRDVLRPRSRAPAHRRADRRVEHEQAVAELRAAPRDRRSSARRRRRTASSPAGTPSTPSTARRSRSGSPTTS